MTHSRRGRIARVLTFDQAQGFTPEQLRWFRALGVVLLPPIAGGSPEGEGGGGAGTGSGEGSGEGTGGGEGSGEGEAAAGGSGEGGSGGGGEEDEDEDEDDEDKDRLTLSKSEYERLRRIAREHDQAEKKRLKDEEKNKERLRKEQGQYEELLREKDDRIAEVEGERDQARYELDQFKRRVRVTEAAKRLNFKDPDDAFRFLSDEDTEDEVTTERSLKRVAKQKPYLVSERRSTGAPVSGDGVTLTLADIKRMSPEEINQRWPEVQKAMAAGQ